jgi:hypothetical protein
MPMFKAEQSAKVVRKIDHLPGESTFKQEISKIVKFKKD